MWQAEWTKWAYSFPDGMNPVQDETGKLCDLGQAGPVWFLAGTFGVQDVVRECTIPAGKAIFYPIINGYWIDCPGTGDADVPEAVIRWAVGGLFDTACQLTSTLDTIDLFGTEVPMPITGWSQNMVRGQSTVFTMDLPIDHLVDNCGPSLPPGETGRIIDGGYYVMLPPLSVGPHTLTLHGAACDSDTGDTVFETSVTYELNVLPGNSQ
jgi:hypothetical protein